MARALGLVIGDGHGSPEFRRQAAQWAAWYATRGGANVVELPVSTLPLAQRYAHVAPVLAAHHDIAHVAVFCHGWADGLQIVPSTRLGAFAAAIRAAAPTPAVVVTLYACSTGADLSPVTSETSGDEPGGDGGFADRLRDELVHLGASACCVDAHTTPGHLAANPYVRRFVGASPLPEGGEWLIAPQSPTWRRWVRALRGDMRWEYPLLGSDVIRARVAAMP